MFIRQIEERDNPVIASIIRNVMMEFKADPSTTILGDPVLNNMYQGFQQPRAAYFIIEDENGIAGGCGIHQLDGTDENICELQRMFLLPASRGKGYGKMLIERCLDLSREYKYEKMYLETLSDMLPAISLYKKYDFRVLDGPLGKTGHGGCDVCMLREL